MSYFKPLKSSLITS